MRHIIRFIQAQIDKLVRAYQFINDVLYYWQRHGDFRLAVDLAHSVIKK